jgi:hypothetical protein
LRCVQVFNLGGDVEMDVTGVESLGGTSVVR